MARSKSPATPDIGIQELLSILRIVKGTTEILDLDELYAYVTDTILQERASIYQASIWIRSASGDRLTPKSISGRDKAQLKRIRKARYFQRASSGILGHVLRTGEAYVSNDTSEDPHYLGTVTPQTRSELCVPMRQESTTLGLLDVESKRTKAFTDSDLLAFQILAEHIANAIKNARIYQDLRVVNQRLWEFQGLARQISSTLDLQEILAATVNQLPNILSLRLCSIFLYNPVTGTLDLKMHNHPDLADKSISIRGTEKKLINKFVGQSKSQWIRNIETEQRRRNKRKYRSKSSLNLILKAGEKLVGVLNLNDKLDGRPFSEHDFSLADYFASHLALSINNCHLYERTLQMALFDGLTGLYVHRHFQEVLEREIARSARSDTTFSLMLADIDHFKRVNDQYGHQSGDTVLRGLADVFRQVVRQVDFVARYGGEEFAFLLPETDKRQAKVLAARIRTAVKATRFRLNGDTCRLSLSFGIAESNGSQAKDDLIRRADMALYRAKRQGRDRIVLDES